MSLAGRTFGGAISLTKANLAEFLHYRLDPFVYPLLAFGTPAVFERLKLGERDRSRGCQV